MATTKKRSGKAARSAKRPPKRSGHTVEFARLADQMALITSRLDEILNTGIFAIAKLQRAARVPLPEYSKVFAVGQDPEVTEVRGSAGIVLDAQESEGEWTYTVYFPAKQETFVLHDHSLWDTGEDVPKDVIYGGGQTRRVRVDANGNGTVVA